MVSQLMTAEILTDSQQPQKKPVTLISINDKPYIKIGMAEKLLGRKRDCIYRWHRALLRHPPYREAGKALREAIPTKVRSKRFHFFQFALLQEISRYQHRGKCNPRKNKTIEEIKSFIDRNAKNWTKENWEAGLIGSHCLIVNS